MKHYTFKTKSISAEAPTNSVGFASKCDNLYPYITYRCKSPVNLNFLFRELVYFDDQVSMVPTAQSADDLIETGDVSATMGSYYCMRFINSIVNSELKMEDGEQSKLDRYIFEYENKYGFTSGNSVQSPDPKIATMDFGEFFQVALSAIRNKSTNAEISARNGLVDRENINNAAVRGDICNRTVSDLRKSELLQTLLVSSTKPGTVCTETIDNNSSLNWMKNLVYDIITKSMQDKENIERFIYIQTCRSQGKKYRIIRLLGGDSIVLVFKIKLTNKNGILINNECPDKQGIPMTIGFRIEQSECAPPPIEDRPRMKFAIPVGWQPVYTYNDPPTNVYACVNPHTYIITVSWNHPSSEEYKNDGFNLFYIVIVLDSRTNTSKTITVPHCSTSEQVGQVSPGSHDILVSMYAVYIKGDIQISSSPVSIKINSIPVRELCILSAHMNENNSVLCIVDPPTIPIFLNKYSIVLMGESCNKSIFIESSTNSFIVPAKELPHGCVSLKIAPIFLINNKDYIGIYSSAQFKRCEVFHHSATPYQSMRCVASPPYFQTPHFQTPQFHPPHQLDTLHFTWKSTKDSLDLVVIVSENSTVCGAASTVYVNVDNDIKTTNFGGFVVYRNLHPGTRIIGVCYEHEGAMSRTVTKNCTIIYNMETSG